MPTSAAVVTENVPCTAPILSVADTVVRLDAEETRLTTTLSPLLTTPAAAVNAPLLIE